MRVQYLLALAAILATASVQAGVHVGSHGVQVGNISVGENGVNITNQATSSSHATSNHGGYGVHAPSNSGVNDTATYSCTAKNPNASINGTNRTITIKGACQTIAVNGTNNTVTAQQANSLLESGTNNTITISKVNNISVKGVNSEVEYSSGLTVKKPTVKVSGVNASVSVM